MAAPRNIQLAYPNQKPESCNLPSAGQEDTTSSLFVSRVHSVEVEEGASREQVAVVARPEEAVVAHLEAVEAMETAKGSVRKASYRQNRSRLSLEDVEMIDSLVMAPLHPVHRIPRDRPLSPNPGYLIR